MFDITNCPECGDAAEVRDRVVLESTDVPIEHAKIFCVRGHWFLMPVAGLETRTTGIRSPQPDQVRARHAGQAGDLEAEMIDQSG